MKVRAKAPLRLGLAGGGTDLDSYSSRFGGSVLNATISLYAHCTIEKLDTSEIIFEALDVRKSEKYELINKVPVQDLKLHSGVYNRIIQDFNNNEPLPVKISTYADAPIGSGLGTSSALVVAMIKAFVEYCKIPLGEYDVAKLAYEIERVDLRLSGGKQDQYAATFGGFNFIEFKTDGHVIVNPLRVRKWLIDELEESMVLFFTGQSRESGNIIDDQIKNTNENNERIAGMHKLKESSIIMKEAILQGNLEAIANEIDKGWQAKKTTSDIISNKKLNDIYDAAKKAGASAGKISGAGGGGFFIFLVDPLKKINVIRELQKYDGFVVNFEFIDNGTKGWYL